LNGTYATTGSNTFKNPQTINSNLIVTGSITAQTLVVQTVSSSVIYSSGSNVFGNSQANTQVMTGSVNITGSVAIASAATYALDVTGGGRITSNILVGNTGSASSVWNRTLQVYDATASALSVRTGVADWHIGTNSTGNLYHYNNTNSTHALTISGSGYVGIGTTTPNRLLDVSTGSDTYLRVTGNRGNADDVHISNVEFYNSNTTRIVAEVRAITGTGGTQSNSGQLVFYTNNAGTYAEKMRITSAGYVNVGYTFNQNYGKLNILSSGQQIYNGIAVYTNGGTDSFIGLGCNDTTAGINITYGSSGTYLPFVAIVAGSERMRITTTGGVGIGTTSVTGTTRLRAINSSAVQGDPLFFSDNAVYNALGLYSAGADGYNAAACVMIMGRNTTNSRSINAGGTINASGADYAEYMTKAIEDTIAKGDIIGVNSNGLLTNIFVDSISFAVKSTDPSYVGGDTWGSVDDIGKLSLEATEEEKAEYNTKLEAARAKVDRIAFSGQVPCNVTGANVGDYIIPIELENGKIGGQAITNPTFEQFKSAVGKVWKIMNDGRAWIKVIN
jgi:hypothetical protein